MGQSRLFLIFGVAIGFLALVRCGEGGHSAVPKKLLMEKCGICHLTPNPKSLSKDIWENFVFPEMANQFVWQGKSTFNYANKSFYNKKNRTPMTDSIWMMLLDYYSSNALDSVIRRKPEKLAEQQFFDVLAIDDICDLASISALNIDQSSLFVACDSNLVAVDSSGQLIEKYATKSIISWIGSVNEQSVQILDPGKLDPHDGAYGALYDLDLTTLEMDTVLRSLKRPVHMSRVGDQQFISEYGHQTGRLSLYDQSTAMKIPVFAQPGSYKSIAFDADGDGSDELFVQFSQALEGIYRFDLADDNAAKKVLAFEPESGLSDMDTLDANGDGFTDLVLTFGDNADYSRILKEYHGVRVYLNNGRGKFRESYRYPMYGASQVRALDVDGDDDMDLICSAFFPDEPSNALRVLCNHSQGDNLAFEAFNIPESKLGRWMVMDADDMDDDGDQDVVIGSFQVGLIRDTTKYSVGQDSDTQLLILKNKSR